MQRATTGLVRSRDSHIQSRPQGGGPMLDIQEVTNLQRQLVARWHEMPVDNPCEGFLAIVAEQFGFNFLLWHEEDIARSPDVGDAKIAEVKRKIDRYNQQRNDRIEK